MSDRCLELFMSIILGVLMVVFSPILIICLLTGSNLTFRPHIHHKSYKSRPMSDDRYDTE